MTPAEHPPAWRGAQATLAVAALAAYLLTAVLIAPFVHQPVLLTMMTSVVFVPIAMLWRRRTRLDQDFLQPPASWSGAAMLCLCWAAVASAGITTVNVMLARNPDPGVGKHVDALAGIPLPLALLSVLVLSPIAEEVLMRGLVFGHLNRATGTTIAATISALVFGLMHGTAVQLVYTIPLGMVLALSYAASGRLWVPIVMHVAYNTSTTLFGSAARHTPAWACAALGTFAAVALGVLITHVRKTTTAAQTAGDNPTAERIQHVQ